MSSNAPRSCSPASTLVPQRRNLVRVWRVPGIVMRCCWCWKCWRWRPRRASSARSPVCVAPPNCRPATFETLEANTLPAPLMRKLRELARGEFLERAENGLAFGLPGVGKSHAACAIGNALVELGHSVLFRPAYQLVQELLAAKRDLVLPQKLRRLDSFELLILDDIGYVKQSPEEAEVLFTLIAERYERRSMLITSNLVFSEWERIFKDPMATAAAI